MDCPVPSERHMRSKTVCTDYRNYTCLFDETSNSFKESCSIKFDFQRPGYRVTLRTNIHAKACQNGLYQPFIFYTNTSSNCELQRSFCSGEGQIVSNNGSIKTDRQCRCNYAQGYEFVTKPRNICSCIPSLEDCTCYRKKCLKNLILSPDYICIDQFSWSGKLNCSSISDLGIPTITVPKKTIHTQKDKTDFSKDNPRSVLPAILLTCATALLLICLIILILIPDNCSDTRLNEAQCAIHCEENENVKLGKKEQQTEMIDYICIDQFSWSGKLNCSSISDLGIPTITVPKKPIHTQKDKTDLNTHVEEKAKSENKSKSFLETDIMAKVGNMLASKNCVLLWGKPGCGKSTSLNYIAMYLQNKFEYKYVPCRNPSDIWKQQYETGKFALVLDDICGRFVLSYEVFLMWSRQKKKIERLLQNGNVKLLMGCSSVVFMTETLQKFNLFTESAIQLPIPNLLLSHIHLVVNDLQQFEGCLPLREELEYSNSSCVSDVNCLRESNLSAFYSLFICILKKGIIDEGVLTSDYSHFFTTISRNISKAFSIEISRRQFFDNLFFLMNKFISKEKSLFSIKEAAMFEALAVYFGDELQQVFIKYADLEIITQHCSLKTCPTIAEHEMFCIEVNEENEKLFFHRIGKLLLSGNIREVFSGRQMKLPLFQQKLTNYFKQLGSEFVKQISRSKCKFENETTFTLASRYECANLLQLFFECDHNLNQENYDHLKSACETNNIPFVKLLIRRGIDINKHTSDGSTFLHIATKNGFWRLISVLISKNADVNCTDKHGNTALIEACKKEDEAVISLLLINGADINKSNFDGQTPLLIATSKGTKRIVDVLIANRADVNSVDDFGFSCLMHSIKSEPQNIGIVRTLLGAGVDLNVSSVDGNTALLIAIQEQQTDIVNILTSSVTEARSKRHADTIRNTSAVDIINKCNNLKVTPLIRACELRNSEFDVVEDLLLMGAIVNCSDHKERTPLIVALENNDNDLVDILVKHGANVNFPGNKRTTPLHEMCKTNHFNNVHLLISKGSDIEIVDRHSMTPLMLASKYGHIDITKLLIKEGVNINSVDLNGMTSLMLACMGGFNNLIELLIENGADVNKYDHNDWTPLLAYANSQHDNPEIIKFLIEKGANSNALTKDKVSSLMMASFRGHLNIVEQLLKLGMHVNHADVYGKTAIFSACLSGNVDIVRTLIDNGADTLISDKNGDTVLTFAKKNKLSTIVDFLSSFSEV